MADETVQPEATETTEVQPDAEPDTEPNHWSNNDLDDAETFPRSYVEKLRKESQGYREKAKTADDLATHLHTALTAATGKLADPSDLAFDAAHLDDADALTAAIDALLAAKPHLRSRKPVGDVGQGQRGGDGAPQTFADFLKA
jgi:hypothetical protein